MVDNPGNHKINPAMQELDLLSLPVSVLSDVLGNLELLADVVRLDSAYCHHYRRDIWLDLLASKQFTLHCAVDISDDDHLSWVTKKSLKCSNVMFVLDIVSYKDVSKYLQAKGSYIRKVHFDGETKEHEMVLVALNCNNLTSLNVYQSTVTCAMRDIMLKNPNLQEIFCTEVKCVETGIFEGVSLHKLTCLYMDMTDCAKGCFWHKTAFSDSLHTVLWDSCNFHSNDLKALFKNCPQIRSFSADKKSFRMEHIHALGVGIINLSLNGNEFLTNAHLLSIVQRLPLLRTLNVQQCPLLTDTSLKHIAKHSGNRLEVLYVDIKHPENAKTEAILKYFSQKCTKLKYFDLNCDKVLCSGKGTSSLVSGCPQLQTLVVNDYSTITASSRGFIEQFRPSLKILRCSDISGYDITEYSTTP